MYIMILPLNGHNSTDRRPSSLQFLATIPCLILQTSRLATHVSSMVSGEYSNPVFTMEDCFDVRGNWTSCSYKDAQSLYTNSVEANASDMLLLDMASESLKVICCNDTLGNSTAPMLTKEEIRNGWWNAVQEWREGQE